MPIDELTDADEPRYGASLADYIDEQPLRPMTRSSGDEGESSLLEDVAAQFGLPDSGGFRGQGRKTLARGLDKLLNMTGLAQGAGLSTVDNPEYHVADPLTRGEEAEIYAASRGGAKPVIRDQDAMVQRLGANELQLQALKGESMLDGADPVTMAGDQFLTIHAQDTIAKGAQASPQERTWAADYLTQRAQAQVKAINTAEKERASTAQGPEDYAQRVMELKKAGWDDRAIKRAMDAGGWKASWVNQSFVNRLKDEEDILFMEGKLDQAMRTKDARVSLLKYGLGGSDLLPGDVMLSDMATRKAKGEGTLGAFNTSFSNAFFSSVRGLHRLAGTLPPGSTDRDILERYSAAAEEEHPVASFGGEIVGGIADPVFLAMDIALAGLPVGPVVKAAWLERQVAKGVARPLAAKLAARLTVEELATEGIERFAIRKMGLSPEVAKTVGRLVWNGASGAVASAGATALQVAPEDMTPAEKAMAVAAGGGTGILMGTVLYGVTRIVGKALSKLRGRIPAEVREVFTNAAEYVDHDGLHADQVRQDLGKGVDAIEKAAKALGRNLDAHEIEVVLNDAGLSLEHFRSIKPEDAGTIGKAIVEVTEELRSPDLAPERRAELVKQWERLQRMHAEMGAPEVKSEPHQLSPDEIDAQIKDQLRREVPDEELKGRLNELEEKARREGGLEGSDLQDFRDHIDQLRERGVEVPAFASRAEATIERPVSAFRQSRWETRRKVELRQSEVRAQMAKKGVRGEPIPEGKRPGMTREAVSRGWREKFRLPEDQASAVDAVVEARAAAAVARGEAKTPEGWYEKTFQEVRSGGRPDRGALFQEAGGFIERPGQRLDVATEAPAYGKAIRDRKYDKGRLYHITNLDALESISKGGLQPGEAVGVEASGFDSGAVYATRSTPDGKLIQANYGRDRVPVVLELSERVHGEKAVGATEVSAPGKSYVPASEITRVWVGKDNRPYSLPEAIQRIKDLGEVPEGQLHQRAGEGGGRIAASVEFAADGKAVIRALERPDVSSVLHELGHVFRRQLPDEDLKIANEWAGATGGVWTREAEEKFARGFERYLREGNAPVPALKRVFEQFKAWLTGIYHSVARGPLANKISPEIRGVFDRLLGAPEIEQSLAKRRRRLAPAIRTIDAADLGSDWHLVDSFTTRGKAERAARGIDEEVGIQESRGPDGTGKPVYVLFRRPEPANPAEASTGPTSLAGAGGAGTPENPTAAPASEPVAASQGREPPGAIPNQIAPKGPKAKTATPPGEEPARPLGGTSEPTIATAATPGVPPAVSPGKPGVSTEPPPASPNRPSVSPNGQTVPASAAGAPSQPPRNAKGRKIEGSPPPPVHAPVVGRESTVEVPGRASPLKVRYALVSADDAIPSHDARAGFEANAYGDRNERPYGDPSEGRALREGVLEKRDRLNPAFILTDTPTAIDGPPIVNPDLVVLGGNARTMVQQLVYKDGGARADQLRQATLDAASKFGIDTDHYRNQVKDPVIVRIVDPTDAGEPGELSRQLNKAFTAARTSDTDAVSRGAKVTQKTTGRLGRLLADDKTMADVFNDRKQSDDLLAGLIEDGAIDRDELVGYTDQRGLLTQEGRRVVERTLLGAAVPDVRRLAEMTPAVRSTMLRGLPAIVQLRGKKDLAFDRILNNTLDILSDYQRSGSSSLSDLVSQVSMFPQPWRGDAEALGMASAMLEDVPTKFVSKLRRLAGIEADTLFGKEGTPPYSSVFPWSGGDSSGPATLFDTAQELADRNAAYGKAMGTGPAYTPNTPILKGAAIGKLQGVRNALRPIEMPELVKLAQELKVNPRIMRMKPSIRGSFGFADPLAPTLSLNASIFEDPTSAAKTLAHEIGHLVDFLDDRELGRGNVLARVLSLKPIITAMGKVHAFLKDTFPLSGAKNSELRKELIDLTRWWKPYDHLTAPKAFVDYRESAVELYADALSVLLNSPGVLEQRAPKFYKELLEWFDRKPSVFSAYLDLQDLLGGTPAELIEARRADIREDFGKGEDILRARAEERRRGRQSPVEFVLQTLWDTAQPIINREKAAALKGIPAAQRQSAQMAMEELAYRDNAARITLGKIKRDVTDAFEGLDVTKEDAGEFLMMNRIAAGDRQAFGNPRGHTPATASNQLREMEQQMGPSKWAKFAGLMQRYQDIAHEVVVQGLDEGIYSQKTFDEIIEPNKGYYATFAVLDHLDDYIGPGIKEQIGTFKGIANPFDATLMKTVSLHRAIELNRAKRIAVIEGLGSWFPGEVVEHKVPPDGHPPRPQPGKDILVYMRDGRPTYHEVDQYVAKSFQLHDIGVLDRIGRMVSRATYGLFHPLFVTYSPSFAVANIQRDLRRTYRNLSAAIEREGQKAPTMAEFARSMFATADSAMKRAKGAYDPLIEEMLANKALDVPFTRYDPGADELVGYEKLLASVGLGDEPGRSKLMEVVGSILKPAEVFSSWTEALPKASAYKILTDKGITGQKRSYIVRNYVGTPNTRRRGLATNLVNGIFMYSNVALQGIRADAELALHPKSAGGFWLRSMFLDVLPKLAMKAGTVGLFGAGVKALFDMIPDYEKSSYIVLPLGSNTQEGQEKAVYLRLMHDDTQRTIMSVAWQLMKGEPAKAFAQLYGQLPISGLSPPLEIAKAWVDYSQGRNPFDDFRKRDIVSRDAWTAGGWYAGQEMLKWTLSQFGVVSTVMHYFTGQPGNDRKLTTIERVIGSVPGLERILRVSDRGIAEKQWEEVDLEDQEKARFKLGLPKSATSLTRERYRLQRLRSAEEHEFKQVPRLERLNAWYRDVYLPLTRMMSAAQEHGDTDTSERIKLQLDALSEAAR